MLAATRELSNIFLHAVQAVEKSEEKGDKKPFRAHPSYGRTR
jgi:hypothetical protein